jgi:hypothetical protein
MPFCLFAKAYFHVQAKRMVVLLLVLFVMIGTINIITARDDGLGLVENATYRGNRPQHS